MTDAISIVRAGAALVLVIGLIVLASIAARRLGYGARSSSATPRALSIVETLPLDAKRRLVVVRHNATEHVLLLGPARDLLIGSAPPIDLLIGSAPPIDAGTRRDA